MFTVITNKIGLGSFVVLCFTSIITICVEPDYDLTRTLKGDHVVPVVVIGTGPAGLTAGIYTVRGGFPTTIYAGELIGGQLTETSYVENYSGVKRVLGSDLMDTMLDPKLH